MNGRKVYRNTRQRKLILKELRKCRSHPTATDVYDIVRKQLPKISLGTVYRNLELLARSGLIHKFDAAGAQARFDGDPGPHYHVRCVSCHRVDDIQGLELKVPRISIRSPNGYEILGHRLEFVGICLQCKRARGSQAGKDSHRAKDGNSVMPRT